MRCFVLSLGVFLLTFLLCVNAAPTDGEYQAEIIDHVSNTSSTSESKSKVKSDKKVKTKHRKDGTTVTVIKSKYKSKEVTVSDSDTYDQTNRTLIGRDGSVDSTSSTKESETKSREVDQVRKTEKEVIITDANGNIISDSTKTKEKDKHKKKAKTKVKKTKKKKKTKIHKNEEDEVSDSDVTTEKSDNSDCGDQTLNA